MKEEVNRNRRFRSRNKRLVAERQQKRSHSPTSPRRHFGQKSPELFGIFRCSGHAGVAIVPIDIVAHLYHGIVHAANLPSFLVDPLAQAGHRR